VAELEQQVAQLGVEVQRLNSLYHAGRPAVTDDVYDSIKAKLAAAEVG
jgi:NAD-dependent DNA ligase